MSTVLKDALGIEHYWGRVEFAPVRSQTHLHMLGIAKDMAHLKDLYKAQTMEDKVSRKFCKVSDEAEDVRLLCQDCMCHHCNRFCMRDNKKNKPRTCRVGFGDEANYGRQDTPGMDIREESELVKDKKGIVHFRMKRMHSKRAVQHSRTLLKGWRANCDIKLLLYFSNPNMPDIGEIEDICKYVVAYTGKRNHTSQQEKTAIQDLITG